MKPLLIDGVWTTTPDGYENINPSDTSDIIDVYAQAGRAETQTAIGAAQAAFGEWEFSAPQRRHDILKAVGDEILARTDEIGHFLSREEGKTLAEGIAETGRAACRPLASSTTCRSEEGNVRATGRASKARTPRNFSPL